MKRVRRPATVVDGPSCLAELRTALDAEGVAPGEQFLVSSVGAPDDEVLGPFVASSDTSRYAALDNYPRAGTQRHRILEELWLRDDATRDELSSALHLLDSTVDPRVWELIHGGWVHETARKRPTRTGSEAHVLELTEKGRAYQANGGRS